MNTDKHTLPEAVQALIYKKADYLSACFPPTYMRGHDALEEVARAAWEAAAQQARARSAILDFQAWAEQRAKIRGPMTQDQYFLAEEAFFAAHPGEHLTSSTMASHPPPTPEAK